MRLLLVHALGLVTVAHVVGLTGCSGTKYEDARLGIAEPTADTLASVLRDCLFQWSLGCVGPEPMSAEEAQFEYIGSVTR